MREVQVAELKAGLSAYLRVARQGEVVVVLNRDTPVARLVGLAPDEGGLAVHRPATGAPAPGQVPLPPPLRLTASTDILLRQEREERL
ncbi:MAG: type II toxin-antitoxin system prevent-host-death family antitoxin [Acidobacteriota bacterium]